MLNDIIGVLSLILRSLKRLRRRDMELVTISLLLVVVGLVMDMDMVVEMVVVVVVMAKAMGWSSAILELYLLGLMLATRNHGDGAT